MGAGSNTKPILCIGEALVDFVALTPSTLDRAPVFERAAGGAPANVAVGLSRLGVRSAYLGKLGQDPFGQYLFEVLRNEGVDVSGVVFSSSNRTGLAFVSLTENGERDFLFAIDRSADTFLSFEDLDSKQLGRLAAIHAGTFCS
jgi:fructokinase